MKKIFLLFVFLFFTETDLHSETEVGIIFEKYANVRTAPSVVNSMVITKAYRGTTVKIVEKTPEKTRIGGIEGYWFKVKLIETGAEGWIFDKYVALEGGSEIYEFMKRVISSLYYYRPDLPTQLSKIKTTFTKSNIFEQLTELNPRFLNYLGYWLLIERNELAFPVLIAFMDPAHEEGNRKDANYHFTWEILERLTPHVLITSDYKSFRYWWQKNWGTIKIDLPSYEMAAIFKKIQDNENQVYRKTIEGQGVE